MRLPPGEFQMTPLVVYNNMYIIYERILTFWPSRYRKYVTTLSECNHCPIFNHGPLPRYEKLRVAHAPGMPGTLSPAPNSTETASYRSWHASWHVRDARAVMHVGIANPWWWGKRSRQMRNPQFCVFGKRPMILVFTIYCILNICEFSGMLKY